MRFERVVILLAAVAACLGAARLGLWQLDRAAQKNAAQSSIDQRRTLPALATSELARNPSEAAAQLHRVALLSGRWMASATVFLENRQMQGRPGFYVLTPLLLEDGTAVVVQRGWLPRDLLDRTQVAAPSLPDGAVRVSGRIAPAPTRLYELGADATGPIRQNLDLNAYAAETGRTLRPLSLLQAATSGGAPPDGLRRDWPQAAAGVEKHYGYAFQWFALSVLIAGLYVWFQLIRSRTRAATQT